MLMLYKPLALGCDVSGHRVWCGAFEDQIMWLKTKKFYWIEKICRYPLPGVEE